jgi:hypothetical protein
MLNENYPSPKNLFFTKLQYLLMEFGDPLMSQYCLHYSNILIPIPQKNQRYCLEFKFATQSRLYPWLPERCQTTSVVVGAPSRCFLSFLSSAARSTNLLLIATLAPQSPCQCVLYDYTASWIALLVIRMISVHGKINDKKCALCV